MQTFGYVSLTDHSSFSAYHTNWAYNRGYQVRGLRDAIFYNPACMRMDGSFLDPNQFGFQRVDLAKEFSQIRKDLKLTEGKVDNEVKRMEEVMNKDEGLERDLANMKDKISKGSELPKLADAVFAVMTKMYPNEHAPSVHPPMAATLIANDA
jgi:hypothetical protein